MSKFSTKPSALHYEYLRGIAKFKTGVFLPPNLPDFTVEINQPKLIAFVDAFFYANDPRKRRSTTGFVFTYCGGAIVYQQKTQSITALSSTEAVFFAAVLCAKIALYLRSILDELGFGCTEPTKIYDDNASTIMIVNSQVPT